MREVASCMYWISVTCDAVLDFLDWLRDNVIIFVVVAAFVYFSEVHLFIYSLSSDGLLGSLLGGWNRDQQVADATFQELRVLQGGRCDAHRHSLVGHGRAGMLPGQRGNNSLRREGLGEDFRKKMF